MAGWKRVGGGGESESGAGALHPARTREVSGIREPDVTRVQNYSYLQVLESVWVYALKQNYESIKLYNRCKMLALNDHRQFPSGVDIKSVVGPVWLHIIKVHPCARQDDTRGSAVVVPRILDLGSGWWVISFTLRPLYSEKRTRGFYLTWVWMGLKVGSNTEEEKMSERSMPSPTHYTDWPFSSLLDFLVVT
jgi:hypothetical protein